jgi:hypothetical protein
MSPSRTPHSAGAKPCRCGESRPEVMTRRGCCYECTLARDGRKRTEGHHPFGRDNPPVAEIPGNWHRALDARRARRPEILKRPGANPLHQIAAIIATLGDARPGELDSLTSKPLSRSR